MCRDVIVQYKDACMREGGKGRRVVRSRCSHLLRQLSSPIDRQPHSYTEGVYYDLPASADGSYSLLNTRGGEMQGRLRKGGVCVTARKWGSIGGSCAANILSPFPASICLSGLVQIQVDLSKHQRLMHD